MISIGTVVNIIYLIVEGSGEDGKAQYEPSHHILQSTALSKYSWLSDSATVTKKTLYTYPGVNRF